MMDLVVADSIDLETHLGVYKIQLCYGDITKLPMEEKVDLIMISAFPGDYAAVRGTVIGALRHNLDLDVGILSRSKEMDMRTHFSCWLSEPLPTNMPYGKLLCFERHRSKTSTVQQIRDMFRVFVPAFRNQETTVITPLLATGNQGNDEVKVLNAMVDSAANWILAGLPMKLLKIVVYCKTNDSISSEFVKLKKYWLTKCQKQSISRKGLETDVFITYQTEDTDYVKKIKRMLTGENKKLNISSENQRFDEEKIWQDKIFNAMISSRSVIAVLTPSFVASEQCLEMFNMAICCNRLYGKEILFPFYVLQINSMPIYMTHVQYFDCRLRQEGDNTDKKIQKACQAMLTASEEKLEIQPSRRVLDTSKYKYDVFISYSHKNPSQAQELVTAFEKAFPDVKVFYDRSELTMGSKWQESLYFSLDSAACIIVLMSPTYLSSTICQEEYNISLARHMKHPGKVLFVPVCVQEIDSMPWKFGQVKLLDGNGDNFQKLVPLLTDGVGKWLKSKVRPAFLPTVQLDAFDLTAREEQREKRLNLLYKIDKENHRVTRKVEPQYVYIGEKNAAKNSVSISFSQGNLNLAVALGNLLVRRIPNLDVRFIDDSGTSALQTIDTATVIIVLLNDEYISSPLTVEELLVSILRQRADSDKKLLYICHTNTLSEKPMFMHLLPCDMSIQDKIWNSFPDKTIGKNERRYFISSLTSFSGSFWCTVKEFTALTSLAIDVLDGFTEQPKTQTPDPIISNILEVMTTKSAAKTTESTLQSSEYLFPMDSKNSKAKNAKNKRATDEQQQTSPAQKQISAELKCTEDTDAGNDTKNTSETEKQQQVSSAQKQVGAESKHTEDTDASNDTKKLSASTNSTTTNQPTNKSSAEKPTSQEEKKPENGSKSCTLL